VVPITVAVLAFSAAVILWWCHRHRRRLSDDEYQEVDHWISAVRLE
jgi:hypothetical protein